MDGNGVCPTYGSIIGLYRVVPTFEFCFLSILVFLVQSQPFSTLNFRADTELEPSEQNSNWNQFQFNFCLHTEHKFVDFLFFHLSLIICTNEQKKSFFVNSYFYPTEMLASSVLGLQSPKHNNFWLRRQEMSLTWAAT